MHSINEIEKIFDNHNEIMSTAELKDNKIFYKEIQMLLENGTIEKVKRGYYYLVNQYNKSTLGIIYYLFPHSIICMNSALHYYGYIENKPLEWYLTFDKNISRRLLKIDYPQIKTYQIDTELLSVGVTTVMIDHYPVQIYDKERTICDVLRNMNRMDKKVFTTAIRNYVNDPKKNISKLMEYAKCLKVTHRVKNIIEVWI
ncbi:MAG TPA: hypothetical protein GX401_00235 [Clostridiales bacterium]|nr:hypothetical protein [Clostridiales bacterium]